MLSLNLNCDFANIDIRYSHIDPSMLINTTVKSTNQKANSKKI